MKKINCAFPSSRRICPIYIGRAILSDSMTDSLLGRYSKVFAVVDRKVLRLHGKGLLSKPLRRTDIYEFPTGERYKNATSLSRILGWLHEQEADRQSLLLAVGGGVVTDITGFAASCYMRGIEYISVPTTLLAQVDAAIGGKTAINLKQTKNIVGAFHFPTQVICEESFLDTLPASAFRDGLVEVLKVFIALDESAFHRFGRMVDDLSESDGLSRMIADAVRLKASVVSRDPYERNLRRVLNFGHTTGHAYEALTGSSHGSSVALGMLLALQLSENHFGLSKIECDRVWKTVQPFCNQRQKIPLGARELWAKIKHDKKRTARDINFVVLTDLGKHKVAPVTPSRFERAWQLTMERIEK